uniref:Uncharacterized protein n=1 Tax=Solanum lycopersicum TaxID=4081 RepID=A0A3Q7FC06_SOLLC
MKLLVVVSFLVSMVIIISTIVGTSTRLPFLIDSKTVEPSQYFTVTGCNNDCDIACCYCDVTKQPPLCVQCCREER